MSPGGVPLYCHCTISHHQLPPVPAPNAHCNADSDPNVVMRGSSAFIVQEKGDACRPSKAALKQDASKEAAVNTAGAKVAAAKPETLPDKIVRLANAVVSGLT